MIGALLPYRAALWLASPLLAGYTLWRGMRDGGARYCKQRLGIQMPAIDKPLWVHCASVGEINTVLPLLKAIHVRHRNLPLLVTTNTPTGREVLMKQMAGQVTHVYLPLDLQPAIARFVRRVGPRCALISETELWPNMYHQCAALDIPLIMINARVSERTLNAPFPVRGAYRHALGQVSAVLAKSQDDANRFRRMGAPPERIEILGNLKFARSLDGSAPAPTDLVGRPYLLAASTHHDEELRITRIWRRLPSTDQVLVIAPRHPERRAPILRALRPLGMETAVRSRGDPVTPRTRIYLADTLGELGALMSHATLVFMGGSLAPCGGHNILEPARLGKAILIGPNMDNFAEETRSLLAAEAIMMVRNDQELTLALERLQADEELRAMLGRTAAGFMAKQADVAQAYLQRLETLCELGDSPVALAIPST